jgi:hypothetical protein
MDVRMPLPDPAFWTDAPRFSFFHPFRACSAFLMEIALGRRQDRTKKMDRRSFLAGMFGLAGAAAAVAVVGPASAFAGIPAGPGILDELEGASADAGGHDAPEVELVDHRRDHRRDRDRHHRRRHRRRAWRTVCRRYRRHGRWHRRCRRERVWVWR